MILSKRTFRERCSDYFDKLRLVQATGVAVILGLLWWKSNTDTEAQLRDQVLHCHFTQLQDLAAFQSYFLVPLLLLSFNPNIQTDFSLLYCRLV